jgi:four helix bundle protein
MKSHRSLLAWQEARAVTKNVIGLSITSWKPQFAAIFGQLQRSSLSVQLNIAEGYAFGDSARMHDHLRIAYASAVETADLLDLMGEYDHFNAKDITTALHHCQKSQRLLIGLMRRYGGLRAEIAKKRRDAPCGPPL